MNARILALLGAGAVVALALVWMTGDRSEAPSTEDLDGLLMPKLEAVVNEIAALEVVGPGGEVVASLHRERDRWRMRQMHDYEADFARIHELLRDLARARRVEAKTDNPEWYGRLGVAAPGEGEGSGTALRFPGSDLPGVIVGERDPAQIGRYVRLEDERRTWLIGQNLELPAERLEWIQSAVMDIPASDISEVSVRHEEGEEVELRPGDEQGRVWVMLDPPEGRDVEPGWRLRQTAGALAGLTLEDVRPAESAPVPADAVETVFRTRDGIVFSARSWSDEQGSWLHFRVSEGTERDATAEAQTGDAGGEQSTERELDVVAVDGRLSPWHFSVSEERFERFRPTREDLLVDPEESEG